MQIKAIGIAVLTAAGLFGCSSKGDVDIGDSTPTHTVGSQLTDYAYTWDGYAEATQFGGGSDRVRLTLDAQGNGTVTLGEDTAPLPSPSINDYPPGWDAYVTARAPSLLTGYAYPVTGAQVNVSRLTLTSQPPPEWDDWCSLFSPVFDGSSEYRCLPNAGLRVDPDTGQCYQTPSNGPEVELVCSKFVCTTACTCDATSCKFSHVDWGPIQLDGSLDSSGSTLTGTLVLDTITRATVRLARQAH